MTNNSEVKDKTTVENNNSNDTANFSYTNQINTVLEDENRILREAVNSLREEIERFKAPSLMIAEVSELINGHAVIKIPNGNKFYVSLSKNIKNLELYFGRIRGDFLALGTHIKNAHNKYELTDRRMEKFQMELEKTKDKELEVVAETIKLPEIKQDASQLEDKI